MGVGSASRSALRGHRAFGRHEVEETTQLQFLRPEEDTRDDERFAIDGDPEMNRENLAVREFFTFLQTPLPFTRAVSPNIFYAFLHATQLKRTHYHGGAIIELSWKIFRLEEISANEKRKQRAKNILFRVGTSNRQSLEEIITRQHSTNINELHDTKLWKAGFDGRPRLYLCVVCATSVVSWWQLSAACIMIRRSSDGHLI